MGLSVERLGRRGIMLKRLNPGIKVGVLERELAYWREEFRKTGSKYSCEMCEEIYGELESRKNGGHDLYVQGDRN